jgi:hypothetical protein
VFTTCTLGSTVALPQESGASGRRPPAIIRSVAGAYERSRRSEVKLLARTAGR